MAEQGQWRVIRNPRDGTSQFEARVVWGEGVGTILRAMFVDASVVVDPSLGSKERAPTTAGARPKFSRPGLVRPRLIASSSRHLVLRQQHQGDHAFAHVPTVVLAIRALATVARGPVLGQVSSLFRLRNAQGAVESAGIEQAITYEAAGGVVVAPLLTNF